MLRIASAVVLVALSASYAGAEANIHVATPQVEGPRQLQDQTASAVVRDYLDAWKSMKTALADNRVDVLDRDFVGTAKERIAAAIKQQSAGDLRTVYTDRSHDIQIVFYSPEGLSVQLIDHVVYDQQVMDHGKPVASRSVDARYVVVLTPSEVRWRVRMFQPAQ